MPLGKPQSTINITPYIDILLVLLIIFMVIQPAVQHDLKARIPERKQDDVTPPASVAAIVVALESDMRLTVNGENVDFSRLGTRIFEILRNRADKRLFIRAADDLPFGSVIHVIDIAKGAGADQIGLLTQNDRV